jgi:hypothetical protein
MRKLFSLAIVAFVSIAVLVGCSQDSDVFQPIVGTWSVTTLGIPTTIVFNKDASTVETTTILGISATKTGTWTSNDTTITRTWSDGSTDVKYYTFADSNNQMILSASADGVAITYTRN